MAVTFSGQLKVVLDAEQRNPLDLGSVRDNLLKDFSQVFTNGVGLDQANRMWHDQRTLAASATENLDLAASLVDAFGNTLTFTRVKAIIVRAVDGNTNSVQVTRPAANGVPLFMAAGDGIALTPGAAFVAIFPDANGIAVTAGTGDLLTITNSAGGTPVTYDIVIIGTV